jgi:LPXTG-motif cell wall-anchored protein
MIRAGLIALVLLIATNANAALVSQIDKITLFGATYRNDVWTLTVTSPVSGTVAYTADSDDEVGCNICNITEHWTDQINGSSLNSLFTATFDNSHVPNDGDFTIIYLTGVTPGQAFSATVSVFEASDSDNNEIDDLEISIETIQSASTVPIPPAILLFGSALLGLGGIGYRRRKKRTTNPDDQDRRGSNFQSDTVQAWRQ